MATQYYTPRQAAKLVGCSTNRIQKFCQLGLIPAKKLFGATTPYLIAEEDLKHIPPVNEKFRRKLG